MPTGYTAGILDGTTKTFKDFAKDCMRAFGATIHMRDEPNNKPYTPITVSDYHPNQIAIAKENLAKYQSISDEDIVKERQEHIEAEIKRHLERTMEININALLLDKFLHDAKAFVPPTPDHEGVKRFMIEQLTSTISYDAKTDYHDKAIIKLQKERDTMTADSIRKAAIDTAEKDLAYHTEELRKEQERCDESNNWVESFLAALDN